MIDALAATGGFTLVELVEWQYVARCRGQELPVGVRRVELMRPLLLSLPPAAVAEDDGDDDNNNDDRGYCEERRRRL